MTFRCLSNPAPDKHTASPRVRPATCRPSANVGNKVTDPPTPRPTHDAIPNEDEGQEKPPYYRCKQSNPPPLRETRRVEASRLPAPSLLCTDTCGQPPSRPERTRSNGNKRIPDRWGASHKRHCQNRRNPP